jgi:hypothetical protein
MKFQIPLLMILLVVACTPQPQATLEPDTPVTSPPGDTMSPNEPAQNPFAPQLNDKDLTRGTVYLNKVDLLIRESFPPQISVVVQGDLPTPCNQLRVEVGQPSAENKIMVDVYSVVDPDEICTQVLEPFEESIDLGTYPTGHYSVWVNDQLAGEFDT